LAQKLTHALVDKESKTGSLPSSITDEVKKKSKKYIDFYLEKKNNAGSF